MVQMTSRSKAHENKIRTLAITIQNQKGSK